MNIEEPIAHVAQDELAQLPAVGILELLAEATEVKEWILIWIHAEEGAHGAKKHI
jgi:hypothetical protein